MYNETVFNHLFIYVSVHPATRSECTMKQYLIIYLFMLGPPCYYIRMYNVTEVKNKLGKY